MLSPVKDSESLSSDTVPAEDPATMLPTTIDELADTIDSWICLRCGAPLNPDQVEELGTRSPIRCHYCSHTLTLGLYLM